MSTPSPVPQSERARLRTAREGMARGDAGRPRRAMPPMGRATTSLGVLVLAALVLAAVTFAACGGDRDAIGEGDATDGRTPAADEVRLVVSRDFGAVVLRDVIVPATEKTDVLRVLAENAEVDTGYGGQFVDGVDGLASSFGGGNAADAADWFYWVDGVMGDVGAADWKLEGGETVWWDYHRWADAMIVPLALHAFPRPYTGRELAVATSIDVAGLGDWAAANGVEIAEAAALSEGEASGGLVLATTAEAADTPWILELLDAAHSGVQMVRVEGDELRLVSPDGAAGPTASAVAQPANNAGSPERPFLVVLGATAADLDAFLPMLSANALSTTVAVALVDGEVVRLPWQGE